MCGWGSRVRLLVLDQLGVTAGQDDGGLLQHQRPVGVRNAHHVADDPQRDGRGEVGHHVDAGVAVLGGAPGAGDVVVGDRLHRADQLLQHARRERLRHDPQDLAVPRIVR
jgi:hypothetical protein